MAGHQVGFLQGLGLGEPPVTVVMTAVQSNFDADQLCLGLGHAVVRDRLDGRCLSRHPAQLLFVGGAGQLALESCQSLLLFGGFGKIGTRRRRHGRSRSRNRDRRRGQAAPLAQQRERHQDAHAEHAPCRWAGCRLHPSSLAVAVGSALNSRGQEWLPRGWGAEVATWTGVPAISWSKNASAGNGRVERELTRR